MTQFIPVLPTVTTTARERAAYQSVGFEQRMRMGNGQFLTYEQIVEEAAWRLYRSPARNARCVG